MRGRRGSGRRRRGRGCWRRRGGQGGIDGQDGEHERVGRIAQRIIEAAVIADELEALLPVGQPAARIGVNPHQPRPGLEQEMLDHHLMRGGFGGRQFFQQHFVPGTIAAAGR